MHIQKLIATFSVDHHNVSKAASLCLVRASERTYHVYLCSESDNKKYDVLFTESRDEAIEAFKLSAAILIDHGKDFLLERLKCLRVYFRPKNNAPDERIGESEDPTYLNF